MIFNQSFYNQTLRRYIVMFGNMFNDMVVQRYDASGNKIQTIGVPVSYAPKEAFLARMAFDPNLDRPIGIQLPQMSFEMIKMSYDPARRLSETTRNVAINTSTSNSLKSQYTPVPWNMNFQLYIYVRNADDGAQLIEQIVPFFGPEWSNKINLIPSMGISRDIPTILNDITSEDLYTQGFKERRSLVYTLDFTTKGYFFGPVKSDGARNKLIKRIQLDFMVPQSNTSTLINDDDVLNTGRSERVIITPGLLANGSPTTNSSASISYQLISANSNYGIASNTFFYQDGLKFNPRTLQDE